MKRRSFIGVLATVPVATTVSSSAYAGVDYGVKESTSLNLPRDRATINAWCRSFYTTNPEVQSHIDKHVEKAIDFGRGTQGHGNFIRDNGIDEYRKLFLEYFIVGEAFIMRADDMPKWIADPDRISVKRGQRLGHPPKYYSLSWGPTNPRKLPSENVIHIPYKISPYDIRGTSIITSHFRDLMLTKKLRPASPISEDLITLRAKMVSEKVDKAFR